MYPTKKTSCFCGNYPRGVSGLWSLTKEMAEQTCNRGHRKKVHFTAIVSGQSLGIKSGSLTVIAYYSISQVPIL